VVGAALSSGATRDAQAQVVVVTRTAATAVTTAPRRLVGDR
jgi:hypothetical protein